MSAKVFPIRIGYHKRHTQNRAAARVFPIRIGCHLYAQNVEDLRKIFPIRTGYHIQPPRDRFTVWIFLAHVKHQAICRIEQLTDRILTTKNHKPFHGGDIVPAVEDPANMVGRGTPEPTRP